MPHTYDFIIVGGGIVGLTTSFELKKRFPRARIAILEKENELGAHASGRNSGVLHSGIYYPAHTLKAKASIAGGKQMFAFAQEYAIPVQRTGKLIVAAKAQDLPGLDKLLQNAKDNGVQAERLAPADIRRLEPYAQSAFGGIYCADTAVINPRAVLNCLSRQLQEQGVDLFFDTRFSSVDPNGALIYTQGGDAWGFGHLFNCAGAHADVIARAFGLARDYILVPFKGIYYTLAKERETLVRASIYPVPNLHLPFLGVHFTRTVDGQVYVGPTAIPAFGRENYGLIHGAQPLEAARIAWQLLGMYRSNTYNFRQLVRNEVSKYCKPFFVKSARELVPDVQAGDLVPSSKVGIRPQLINMKEKKLEMDYIIEKTTKSTHVLNAISPAFTASFAFAKMIVNSLDSQGAQQSHEVQRNQVEECFYN